MRSQDDKPKLRLAPPETAEDVGHRFEREQRVVNLARESELDNSLAPFRVGSVPYLNAAPLTRGIEREVVFVPPSRLAEMLRRGDLDAALVSVTEVLFHGNYDVLNGVCVASLNEVYSVFLAHKVPLEKIGTVHCDTASLSSVNLLKVLLLERGVRAEFVPLDDYAKAGEKEAVLLIGDPAIEFRRADPPGEIWDLGLAWSELTSLPFVYAVWALRRGIENSRLRRQLREAKDFGLDTLDHLIRERPEFDYEFRKDYLNWRIHYHLGSDERRGLSKFIELLRKHDLGPVHDIHFVA